MKYLSDPRARRAIIACGRELADAGLIAARAGNISCRLSRTAILITATGARLGNLRARDIVMVELASGAVTPPGARPSSELALHRAIYRNFPCAAVVHCHPPLCNAYFSVCERLQALTYETRFYLGQVPVVDQRSLTVARPERVIAALRANTLAVVRRHGVFCYADAFAEALSRIRLLEEAVRVAAVARLFDRRRLDAVDRQIRTDLAALRTPRSHGKARSKTKP